MYVDPGPPPEFPMLPPEEPYVRPSFTCDASTEVGVDRLWRINPTQYANTLKLLYTQFKGRGARPDPVPAHTAPFNWAEPADRFSTYSRSYTMSSEDFSEAQEAASVIAQSFAHTVQVNEFGCVGSEDMDACLRALFAKSGKVFFRRDLEEDELDTAMVLYAAGADHTQGLATVFEYQLTSPFFLFLNLSRASQTSEEFAILVNMILLDDPKISGSHVTSLELGDEASMRAYVDRQLGDEFWEHAKIREFFGEFAEKDFVELQAKDKGRIGFGFFPGRLQQAWDRYLVHLLSSYGTQGFYEQLMTGSEMYVTRNTTDFFYGPDDESLGPNDAIHDLPNRWGFVTHPIVMAAKSHMAYTDPMERGRYFAESIFCMDIPSIPVGVVAAIPEVEGATMRQRVEAHHVGGTCTSCHKFLDPAGLGLEIYDDVGRWRATEEGQDIEVAGTFLTTEGGEHAFETVEELMTLASTSTDARECFVLHNFEYWVGRKATEADGCTLVSMYEGLFMHDSYKRMLVEMLISTSVHGEVGQ